MLEQWEVQRWRPQYGGLGFEPEAHIPDILCEKWGKGQGAKRRKSNKKLAARAAQPLAGHIEKMVVQHPAAYRGSVARMYAWDFLDRAVQLFAQMWVQWSDDGMPHNPLVAAAAAAAGVGAIRSGEGGLRLALLVRSLNECPA
jgi:hypothetical protein